MPLPTARSSFAAAAATALEVEDEEDGEGGVYPGAVGRMGGRSASGTAPFSE